MKLSKLKLTIVVSLAIAVTLAGGYMVYKKSGDTYAESTHEVAEHELESYLKENSPEKYDFWMDIKKREQEDREKAKKLPEPTSSDKVVSEDPATYSTTDVLDAKEVQLPLSSETLKHYDFVTIGHSKFNEITTGLWHSNDFPPYYYLQ